MTGPRIAVLDIETAPLQSHHWGLWQQNISLAQITIEWSILSFCNKWAGEKAIEYMDTSKQEDVRDDSELLHRLWAILDEADFVVAQNGKKFDIKKIKARMVMHGLPPFSPVIVIDTLLIAKAEFGFTSNKLEWMTGKLTKTKKRKHKKFPGFELWTQCLLNNPEAWKEMRLYNIDDVVSLEELYYVLRPWATGHPNVAAFFEDDKTRCAKCGHDKLTQRGYQYTQTGQYKRYSCNKCGGWSRSRYTLNTLEKRQALLSN
jgi:hypothetical protein